MHITYMHTTILLAHAQTASLSVPIASAAARLTLYPSPGATPAPARRQSGANIIGYVRCKKDAGSRITNGLQGMASRAGMNNIVGQALQSAAGRAFGL
jgi:hypothetical protein